MSEPVGNAPREVSVPGNSHKQRDEQQKQTESEASEPREPVEKITSSPVVVRKSPWYKKLTRSVIAEDIPNMGEFIYGDLIVPAIRNLIWDVVTGGSERVLFGHSRGRPRMGRGLGLRGESESLRTRYDRISSDREPRRMMSREARARHDFEDIVIRTREEAVEVIEELLARVDKFNAASVADLYDLVGVTSGSFADQRWGWTNLDTADIRPVRGGFLLLLPRTEPLR